MVALERSGIRKGLSPTSSYLKGLSFVLIVLALTFLMLGICSSDDSDATEGYEFEVDQMRYRIISDADMTVELYDRAPILNSNDVVIPDTVKTKISNVEYTYNVVKIKNSAFNGCTSITSLDVGDTVTSIESSAFYGCYSLRTVRLGNSVNSIGTLAFGGCYRLVEICNDSQLTITKGSTDYGRIALYAVNIYDSYGSSVLKTLDLEEQGRIIYYTISLDTVLVTMEDIAQDVTLPDQIFSNSYSVMDYAFYSMTDLRSIVLGSGVTALGESAFASCVQLDSITLNNGLATVGNNAFSGCSSLASINVPDSVLELGYNAFYNCISLNTITGGNGVTYIWDGTFSGCHSLTAFICGNNIKYIGSRAFENCTALSKLIIGSKVDTLMNNAFVGCNGIKGSVSDICVGVTATTVPAIGNDVFPAGTYISVPAEQLSSYKSQWSAYADTIYPDTYSVKFMNGTEVFSSYSAHYGDVITLPSTQPVKSSTDKYDYRFKSWSGYTEGMTVTGNMNFNAEYEEIPKEVPGSNSGGGSNSVLIIVIIVIVAVLIIAGIAFFLIKKKHHE